MHTSVKTFLALGLASVACAQHTKQDDEMGPAAFMWPADRVWSGDMDNQEPCGSRAGVGNRTQFPLVGGKIALVAQDDYYNTKISISYKNDPTTNSDFTTLIEEQSVADLNPGHTCVDIPNPPSSVAAGGNATLQIIYRADWDAPHNQTFYACSDITYVDAATFNTRIPCFNATEPGEDDIAATASPSASASNSASNSGSSSGGGGGGGLSGGAIAGIVIGAVAGVGLLVGAALFFYRKSQQKKRNSRLARMEENARNSEHWIAGKNSSSQNSVQLNNLP
ncbi:Putative copper acquisition factor BIM1-like domain-containing protein [Colletotrichum destructivum]|uniref:Copper acquisition factor BIM1-like domain-containing protein n=1 Tax=Colletotrichum destructivum TaxID=34406 RepID=A0AAX4IIT1_9PEZI|nr:Putative copper acquisition factor BIM1-like domain-containing protein [Colletotrichum destructivum]